MTGIPLKYRSVEEMDRQMRFPKVMMIDEPALLDNAIARIPAETRERYTILKARLTTSKSCIRTSIRVPG